MKNFIHFFFLHLCFFLSHPLLNQTSSERRWYRSFNLCIIYLCNLFFLFILGSSFVFLDAHNSLKWSIAVSETLLLLLFSKPMYVLVLFLVYAAKWKKHEKFLNDCLHRGNVSNEVSRQTFSRRVSKNENERKKLLRERKPYTSMENNLRSDLIVSFLLTLLASHSCDILVSLWWKRSYPFLYRLLYPTAYKGL